MKQLFRTPAQKRVDLYELGRSLDIESRLNRLRWIKKYNIRFEVANELVHVYLGDLLVVCIGRHEGHHYTVEECLFTLYSTLEAMERYYDNVK